MAIAEVARRKLARLALARLRDRRSVSAFGNVREAGQITPARFRSRLLGIEPERFELVSPFGGGITKTFDADAAWQAALDRRFDESRCEKGKRDGKVDLSYAALFARGDLFRLGD